MLLYISVLGIFLSLILLYFNARNSASSIYLGIYFILVCLYGINAYVLMFSKSIFWITIFCANVVFATYAVGPLSYIYIRSVLTDDARLKLKDMLHFIPMLVYLLAALPYMFTSYAFKVDIAKSIVADPGFIGQYHFTILSDWFTPAGVYLSRPVLAFGYSVASGIMLYKQFKSSRNTDSQTRERFIRRWLITLSGFQLVLIVSHIFFLFGSFDIATSYMALSINVLNFTTSIGLIGLILSPILFPRILYGLPIISTKEFVAHDVAPINSDNDALISEISEISETSKTSKAPAYEEKYMHFITEKVDECMNKHQLYLQKNLNLPQLSVLLNIPTHHLAYYFTGYMEMTFNDYRNVFRVEHAKRLIQDQKTSLITLEAVGLLSGFPNRNTFSRVFKELEGITPSAFAISCSK